MLVYEPSDALEHQHYITWHWFLVKYNFKPNINTSSQLSYWYITCLEFIMPVLGLLFITYIILMFYKDQNQNVITLNHAIIFILLLISMPNSAQLFYLLPSYKEAQKKQVKIDPKKIDNNFYIDDKSYDGILSTYFYVYCKDTKKIMDALDTVNITYDLYLMNPNILEIDFKNLKPEFISKIKLAASLLTKDPIINKSNMTLESIGEVVITKNI
jgi:hypothetical protein